MLNISIEREPKLSDYGLTESDTEVLDKCSIKPKRKARTKAQKVDFIAGIIVFMLIAIPLAYFGLVSNIDSLTEIYLEQGIWTAWGWLLCVLVLLIFVFLWMGVYVALILHAIVSWLLNKLPIKDTAEVYRAPELFVLKKQKDLKEFRKRLEENRNLRERLCVAHPYFKGVIIDTGFDFRLTPKLEAKYIRHCIEKFFVPLLINADNEERMKKTEEYWVGLDPYSFETAIANWYKEKGYATRVTSRSNDGGYDVVAQKGDETIFIQCKHYKNKISPQVVRELRGVMAANNVHKGVVACLNGATAGASDFAKSNNIKFLTLSELCEGDIPEPGSDLFQPMPNNEPSKPTYDIIEGEKYFRLRSFVFEKCGYETEPLLSLRSDSSSMLCHGSFKVYSFYLSVYGPADELSKFNVIRITSRPSPLVERVAWRQANKLSLLHKAVEGK